MRHRKWPLLALVAVVAIAAAACSSWERNTYKSLAASKAVIDQAAADYNAGTIPRTKTAYALIAKARAAQTAAAEAFEEYAVLKVSRQTTSLAQQQQLVVQAVANIPPLVAAIQQLYSKGGGGAGR